MKNTLKLAAVGVLLAGSLAQIQAQETFTYWAQSLNISLTGYVQGDPTETDTTVTQRAEKVRITNRDIVTLLGGTTRGQLVILDPVDFEGDTLVVIREKNGRDNVDTDVSGAFIATTQEGAFVESSKTVFKGDRVTTSGTAYSIDNFSYGTDDTDTSFEVQGFTAANLQKGSFSSTVNGTGAVRGAPAVLTGKISATGGKSETFVSEE